jgi:3-oxoacyl-[acyl-carrier-protein] synthase III
MAFIQYNGVRVSGISACVPKNISNNRDMVDFMPMNEVNKVVDTIGIHEKRHVDDGVSASDLCVKAAEHLLNTLKIDRESIDLVIFMSQSPDFKIPATSPSIQDRLGLPISTAAFDISLACSGYIYSLATAFSYTSQNGINRALLLDGETFSKIVNKRDKINAPLYGDAGTATLIEKDPKGGSSYFSLFSDGSGQGAISINAGGARYPSNPTSKIEKKFEDGSIRSDEQLYMNGVDVFNFAMKRVPKNINYILSKSGLSMNEIDYIIFHQANKFMTDFFVKKLKSPLEKVLYSLQNYGNTSSASIPLNIVANRDEIQLGKIEKKLLLSGFGAGLSWGSSIINFDPNSIIPLIEY